MQGQRHIKLLATEVTRMRTEIQVVMPLLFCIALCFHCRCRKRSCVLASACRRRRVWDQVLESKLALKNGAEGSSVDVNMQQLQVLQYSAAHDA